MSKTQGLPFGEMYSLMVGKVASLPEIFDTHRARFTR